MINHSQFLTINKTVIIKFSNNVTWWQHKLFSIPATSVLPNILSTIVLCGKYRIQNFESNSYFSIQFDSKQAQLFEIFEYLPSSNAYLFSRMTPIFHLSNHS